MKFLVISFCLSLFTTLLYAQEEPIYIEGKAQGTTYHITYFDAEKRNFSAEITQLLQDFDKSVSTYDTSSIISKINRNVPNVVVDETFITCFKKAKEIHKNTNGAFDPTVYPLVNAWGFGPEKYDLVSKDLIDSLRQFVGFDKIKLKGNKIVKKDPRVRLDFNAFAQGYSVDLVAKLLKNHGIKNFIVEIGGEVYAEGKQADSNAWTVGIEEPLDNKISTNPFLVLVEINQLAVATSGNYRRFTEVNGVKVVHHIDPITGYPTSNNLLSASIFSNECITSDATATGILVMGLEKAKIYLEKHKELEAILIYSDDNGDYQVYETNGAKRLIIPEIQPGY